MKTTELNAAIEVLKANGYILPTKWCVDDIKFRADDLRFKLNKSELNEIINFLDNNHDASIGINWDFIDTAIEYIKTM